MEQKGISYKKDWRAIENIARDIIEDEMDREYKPEIKYNIQLKLNSKRDTLLVMRHIMAWLLIMPQLLQS